MRVRILTVALLLAGAGTASAQQAPPAGDAVFARACASCHQAGQTAVPPPDALRALTPEAIVNALTNGKMAVQGAGLTAAERVAVAQFLTGRAPAASAGRSRTAARRRRRRPIRRRVRAGWLGQRRHQLALRAAGRPDRRRPASTEIEMGVRLRGRHIRARPAGDGRRQAVRRQRQRGAARARSEDRLHLLDLQGGVRRPERAHGRPYRSGGATRYAVFFGDQRANAYAVDTITGQQIWKRKVDEHPRPRSPALADCRRQGLSSPFRD